MAVHLSYADNSAVLRRPGISERNSADFADHQKCSACKYHSAAVFYGSQRSADSAGNNAREFVSRINDILSQTDCEKVNMIVHLKNGVDCKCTVYLPSATDKALNLTAAGVPYKGRRIADHLPAKAPKDVKSPVAANYSAAQIITATPIPVFLQLSTALQSCQAGNLTAYINSPMDLSAGTSAQGRPHL